MRMHIAGLVSGRAAEGLAVAGALTQGRAGKGEDAPNRLCVPGAGWERPEQAMHLHSHLIAPQQLKSLSSFILGLRMFRI
jgi:hypothetical protein